jgi:uncharacterized protein (DUF2126 family)/transglutaminase-like putative cysteine protease
MAIHVAVDHTLRYRYDRPVRLSPHVLRLRPAPHTRTRIHDYRLTIDPPDHRLYWQTDPFGNMLARVVFPEAVHELCVGVRIVAEMTVINPFDFFVESYAEDYPFRYEALLGQELEPYFEVTERGPRLTEWLAGVSRDRRHIVDFLVELNARLQKSIGYAVRLDPGVQTCEETFERGIGSCRDTGWLLVQILRHLGLAARFVSGYLVQLAPDEKSLDGPSGPEEDFTDLHAWAEVYVPGAGWVGLDPTSGLFAGEGHIPLACTPDAVSATPVTGSTEVCETEFAYENVVSRVHEDPRVTKPYSDTQWSAIQALGRSVDTELKALDVRLTMGGEPTFVSIDDMEGAEWNTAALGVHKRERAGVLLQRLKGVFAPGGVPHYGQGKWYPGEPLPRWALGYFWRSDGQALWRDEQWIADERKDYGFGVQAAERFGQRLTSRLGLDAAFLLDGFEDWAYYLWREANEPVTVDPLAIPEAPPVGDDLSLALARGLDRPVGYALPLTWDGDFQGWRSGAWAFAREAMYLVPGSSPMGLRLPLDQLPWTAREVHEKGVDSGRPGVAPHTALCVEPREGRLYLFMPLLMELEPYAALLAAVEATAAELHLPVLIEGYDPPGDPALRSVKVTPDPGVIEVNVPPVATWEALEHNTVRLYEEARRSRLGTEKFMLDGRHTGTGGGNHVTLGGPTPEDSPFLRRPDLLRSLITYWQHHPSLSYLFSGLFVGPTSQAPRVDERGSRALRELELSFDEIEQGVAPSVLDRALRSFLTDLTGNTHRAEFCIDKLYSKDSAAGRQGLVEFRAFEMPPHARMSLAQMSLLRALVARFWKQPYRHPLVPWGTQLHDRFMLPEVIWADLRSVIEDFNAVGYEFCLEWFAPFLEFRFPVYGRVAYDGVALELRMALEPWLVLGAEATAHRQARVVDSAVERLQVKCRGLDPARHLLTCNGRRLPLQPTGEGDELVAGVRYKAWKAAFGLHPTVEAHAPLVVDVFDRRLGRAIGGCVYHVAHPGGKNPDTFSVNAYEAEARRIARFWSWGHTAGTARAPAWVEHLGAASGPSVDHGVREPAAERPNPEYPYTLDLRRVVRP